MSDTMKIGAAALGGYVLGRTKKAKAAVGLALWLGGRRHLTEFARGELVQLARSEHGQEIAGAGRHAVLALVEKQAGRLGDAIERRAEALSPDDAPAKRPSPRAPSRRRRRDEPEDEYDDDTADGADEDDDSDEDDGSDGNGYEDEYDDDEQEDGVDEEADGYEDEYDDEEDEYDDDEDEDEGYEDEYDDEDEDEEEPARKRVPVGARRTR